MAEPIKWKRQPDGSYTSAAGMIRPMNRYGNPASVIEWQWGESTYDTSLYLRDAKSALERRYKAGWFKTK